VRSPDRGLAIVFYKIEKAGRGNVVFGVSGQSLWERWALSISSRRISTGLDSNEATTSSEEFRAMGKRLGITCQQNRAQP